MADYTTTVTLRSDVTSLTRGLAQASQAIDKFQANLARLNAGGASGGGMVAGAEKAAAAQQKVASEATRTAATVEQSSRRQTSAMSQLGSAGTRVEQAHRKVGQAATQAGQAVDRASAGHARAGQQAEQAAGRTASSYQRATRSVTDFGKSMALSMAGFAVAGGVAKLGMAFVDFDRTMSGVQANTRATGTELASLRQAAMDAGAATSFSATEAAQGINELAKAGITTTDVLGGGLRGALDLAAAGQLSVAEAAETSASAMTQFGLSGRDVPRIADMLSNAANTAQGSVHDMGAALNQTGLVANGFGMSMQDTVTSLTLFARAGLIGSDAGTSLKTMIQRLQNPTDEARAAMAKLGLTVYDAQGRFVGMRAIFDQLQTSTKGMAQEQRDAALATIFGADAVRGANAAIQAGASGWDEAAAAVTKWGGAQQQAAALTDNLAGDLERLGGSLETVFIQNGSAANGGLRMLVQSLEGFVDVVGSVPAPVMGAVAALTAMHLLGPRIGNSLQPATTGLRGFITTVQTARTAQLAADLERTGSAAQRTVGPLTSMGATARGLVGSMGGLRGAASGLLGVLGGPWGIALAAAGVGLSILGQRSAEAKAKVQELTSAYQADGNAVGEYTRQAMATQAVQDGVSSAAKRAGLSMTDFASAVTGTGQQYAAYRQSLDASIGSHMDASGAMDVTGQSLQTVYDAAAEARGRFWEMKEAGASTAEAMTAFGASAEQAGTAAGKVGAGAGEASAGLQVIGGQVQASGDSAGEAAGKFDQLVQAIAGLGSVIGGQREAVRGYEAALDAASEAAAANGRTLDAGTEKGRANATALDGIATSALNLASKSLQAGESVGQVAARVQTARDAFVAQGQAMGLTAGQAAALADSMGLIPSQVTTTVDAAGVDVAGGKIDTVTGKLTGLDGTTATVTVNADPRAAQVSLSDFVMTTQGTTATATVDANIRPGVSSLAVLAAAANGTTGTATVDANIRPGVSSVAALEAAANSASGTATVKANAAPAQGTLRGFIGAMNSSSGTSTVKAQAAPAQGTLRGFIGMMNSASGTATIKGNNRPGVTSLQALQRQANGTTGTIKVAASTGAANAAINAAARTRTAVINVVQRVSQVLTGGFFGNATGGIARTIPGYAGGGELADVIQLYPHGGAVTGPGTTTSDSVNAVLPSGRVRLSNREHILTADDVTKAGGHQAIYALRSAIQSGWRVPGYATGGATNGVADMTRLTRTYQPLTTADVTRMRDAYWQAAEAQMAAAKANGEAQAELRKAKRGTQAFADALVRANASLFKYDQANRALAAARVDVNTTAATAKQSVTAQWRASAMGANSRTRQFLADIQAIADRGYPVLARELLALGEEEAGALARKAVALDVRGLQQMTHEINTSAQLEARRDDLSSILAGTKKTTTTNPMVQIRASDFALTTARAAAAILSGPAGQNTMRAIPSAAIPTLPPAGVTRTHISAPITVTESRSGYHTAQQVSASLSWEMNSWGGAVA